MASILGPLAAQRARNARITAHAVAIASALERDAGPNDDASSGDARGTGSAPAQLPVVLLPANTRALVPLPRASAEAFLAHLDTALAQAFAQPLRDNLLTMTTEEASARADAGETASWDPALSLGLVAAACGTCRGSCCTAGGTHAFLKADSLIRVRAHRAPTLPDTPSAIRALYVDALPARHYRDSCVFHTTGGCALPRGIRSNLCNRYQCGGLTQLSRALADSGGTESYVAAADSSRLRRMARISDAGAHPIAITARVTDD
jgi:hypothetical protein